MRRARLATAAVTAALLASPAAAQTCSGFTDVQANDPFCVYVDWMRNRGITLGCTTTRYCPADYVTRIQMAAFMYRLGVQNAFLNGGNPFGGAAVLGTTDNQPLEVRVNGVHGWRLEPNAAVPNVIGGFAGNFVVPGTYGSVIGGGGGPSHENSVERLDVVGGGEGNHASVFASVTGGSLNTAQGSYSAVGGGEVNAASGANATVGGGFSNLAAGVYSTVAGGSNNRAFGDFSAIAGGSSNFTSGSHAFGAGFSARADGDRCAVFSLWNSSPGMPCFGISGIFLIGAPNGFAMDYWQQRQDGGGTRWIGIGRVATQTISTWTGAFLTDGGAWTNASDAAAKDDFADVDDTAILERLAALPVRSWRYKAEPAEVRRIGPTAQDFHAAFGVGSDDRTIATVDANGVALSALKGLNAKLEARIAEQQALMEALRERLDRLEARAAAMR